MKTFRILGALGLAAAIGCGGSSNSDTGTPDSGTPDSGTPGFPQPAGTVAVNFGVDDSANKLYGAGDLAWKGSHYWNKTTRKITVDSSWTGGDGTTTEFPPLYDDGPWTSGGHEPAGATANDHKWGVTVFVTPPATGTMVNEYGLNDNHACGTSALLVGCNGWSWIGTNGSYTVAAGATAPVTASGRTIGAFGTTDLRLTVDTANLDQSVCGTPPCWNTTKVSIKGSQWNWSELELKDDGANGDVTAGDGKFTFVISNWAGAGKLFLHAGMTKTGDKPEFNFVFNGVEYKDANTDGDKVGVTAETKASGGSFTARTLQTNATNHNTYIDVP